MAFQVVCEQEITFLLGQPNCPSGWEQRVAVLPFDYSQIAPETAVSMFGLGFVLVAVPWAVSFGLGRLIQMIQVH